MNYKIRSKKMSKSGSITIPSDIRKMYGFNNNEHVKIEVQADGSLLITQNKRVCLICSNSSDVHVLDGIAICSECVAKLVDKISKSESETCVTDSVVEKDNEIKTEHKVVETKTEETKFSGEQLSIELPDETIKEVKELKVVKPKANKVNPTAETVAYNIPLKKEGVETPKGKAKKTKKLNKDNSIEEEKVDVVEVPTKSEKKTSKATITEKKTNRKTQKTDSKIDDSKKVVDAVKPEAKIKTSKARNSSKKEK